MFANLSLFTLPRRGRDRSLGATAESLEPMQMDADRPKPIRSVPEAPKIW